MRAVLLALALWSATAQAQPQAPTPARVAAATELVATMRPEVILGPAIQRHLQQVVIASLLAVNPGRQAEIERTVYTAMLPQLAPLWQVEPVRAQLAQIYASLFTEAELAELKSFFRTPTGQRFAINAVYASGAHAVLVAQLFSSTTAQGALLGLARDLEARGVRFPSPSQAR
jgi:hypothetical protein